MKKAKWIILAVALALCLCIVAGLFALRGKNITVGRCLVTNNGSYMLIDGNTPIRMSTRSGSSELFAGLQDGDRILVVHGMVAESYPAQTIASCCIRLGAGSVEDIPLSVRNSLAGLGWLPSGEELLENAQRVTETFNGVTLSLTIPEGWQWETVQGDRAGILFYPEGEEGVLGLYSYSMSFGVCGTGLRQETITLHSGLSGYMGTYDNSPFFDFISFQGYDCAVINEGADSWWQSHGAEAMAIINSITISVMTTAQGNG